jgi:hypothetical protein
MAKGSMEKLGKELVDESAALNKPAYGWHPEAKANSDNKCTRCRLYRAVALGVYDQLWDLRNAVQAFEVATQGERDLATRRASGFSDLFLLGMVKENLPKPKYNLKMAKFGFTEPDIMAGFTPPDSDYQGS